MRFAPKPHSVTPSSEEGARRPRFAIVRIPIYWAARTMGNTYWLEFRYFRGMVSAMSGERALRACATTRSRERELSRDVFDDPLELAIRVEITSRIATRQASPQYSYAHGSPGRQNVHEQFHQY